MDSRNLILTGFMGTGKTTVGRLAAARLDREFVDMDRVIATREGTPVSEIFAQRGEPYFRALERELCVELSARTDLVIATGGGTCIDPVNRARFANAAIFCLDADADEIIRRLNGAQDRPLLNSQAAFQPSEVGRRERIQELLAARQAAYAEIPVHVNTTGREVEEVAREVVERFVEGNLRSDLTLQVRTPAGSHPVWLGSGMLARAGGILPRDEFAARGVVVTNPTVGRLYAARVVDSLRAEGFDPVVVEIPDGEAFKNLDTLRSLYDRFAGERLERRSPVLALGGGVIGDIAGFAAATFMRGVPFVQLPTTLLAMVDASIGGKVAVDHPSGKNLIGAFKFPRAVIVDPDVLASLPAEESRAGLAEVVKGAIIGDAALFDELAQLEVNAPHRAPWGPDLIARAMRVKIDLVERDPFEENVRAHLNLGHTFGHALETLSGYRLRHGYAVAIGVAIAARLARRLGRCDEATQDRIVALLERNSLPARAPREFDADRILDAMGADKKIREGRLRLILPRAIGEVEIVENVPREDLVAALEDSRA